MPGVYSLSRSSVIVLVTVNENETSALLDAFVGVGKSPLTETRGEVTYNRLGQHGGHQIIHAYSEMGSDGVGASAQSTRDAIDHWSPKAVIAVGIAFGVNEEKQSIGDVLVSRRLQGYDHAKVNESGALIPRGDTVPCSQPLLKRLQAVHGNRKRVDSTWPRIQFGLVLSGQKLVDNLDYRESLKRQFPEAIGGEMEGVGVYANAYAQRVDWVTVKAICDWAHDKGNADKEKNQLLAARNASLVVKAALDEGLLYHQEPNINSISAKTSKTLASLSPGDQDLLQAVGTVNLRQDRDRQPLPMLEVCGAIYPPGHLCEGLRLLSEQGLIEEPIDRSIDEMTDVTITNKGFEAYLGIVREQYDSEKVAIQRFLVGQSNTTDMTISDTLHIPRPIVEHVLVWLSDSGLISLAQWNASLEVHDVSERLCRLVDNLNGDYRNGSKKETFPLRILGRLKEGTSGKSIEIFVHADRSVDEVGVFIVGSDPELEELEGSPIRPVGRGETDRVTVHPGVPAKFTLLSCPQFHRDVNLLTVHPGSRSGTGRKVVASKEYRLRQDFTLLAAGRDATSEKITFRLTKEHENISVEQI